MLKKWIFRGEENSCDQELTKLVGYDVQFDDPSHVELADKLGISTLFLQLLKLRGFFDEKDIQDFLSPNLRLLAPLEAWPGVMECAEKLVNTVASGKKLAVWGDYDVDGITSTCLVADVLEWHGFSIVPHIPDRVKEGYGLNKASLDKLRQMGVEAILTVDCGISDCESIDYAKKIGMTVIISDHHLPPEVLPNADAICNPRLADCPCPYLAGVGVAFFLMCAVNIKLQKITQKKFDMRQVLDLVALGTLADVVLLNGQNRILVKNGLLKIAEATRFGLAALKSVCNYDAVAKLGAGQVVFTIAPRINAAGRMGSANLALDLLRAKDMENAMRLARELDTMNCDRRKEEESVYEEARAMAIAQKGNAGLVLYSSDWHNGIIGIVASRIVEEFYCPTLILCNGTRGIKGSGRSIKEFHLHEGLVKISDILTSYGGHKLAAGLSLEPENLDELRTRFDKVVRESLGDEMPTPSLNIDGELDFEWASKATFLNELELLQPFGMGNAQPIFASPPLFVKNVRPFGMQKNHALFEVVDENSGITLFAKAWGKADEYKNLGSKNIKIAYTPVFNKYNRVTSIELHIKDMYII